MPRARQANRIGGYFGEVLECAVPWTLGYNHRNQLIWTEKRATDGGTLQTRVEFKYDAWGNRIEKKVDADGNGSFETTQKFAYDGWNPAKPSPIGNENFDVWADLTSGGSLTTRYLRGDVVDEVFARMESGTDSWYHNDRLGSIRDIADDTGTVVDSLTYDGFGNIIAETNATNRGRYAWTGRELDTEIALQYNRARYYDAATGRWISQDPLGFDAGDGNLYRYVRNSSIKWIDPSGLRPDSEFPDWQKKRLDFIRDRWLKWIVELPEPNTLDGGFRYAIRCDALGNDTISTCRNKSYQVIEDAWGIIKDSFGKYGPILDRLNPPPRNPEELISLITDEIMVGIKTPAFDFPANWANLGPFEKHAIERRAKRRLALSYLRDEMKSAAKKLKDVIGDGNCIFGQIHEGIIRLYDLLGGIERTPVIPPALPPRTGGR